MSYVPKRGDVIWITLDPQVGHEQAGRRPALVLSPANYNARSGLAILFPITNQAKGYPFEVRIPEGLVVTGVILVDQMKSVDWGVREAAYLCSVPVSVVQEVWKKLARLLEQ
jgi:mRNA interferase MazF